MKSSKTKFHLLKNPVYYQFLIYLFFLVLPSTIYSQTSNAGRTQISGVVKEDSGEPVIGARVLEKGTTTSGTITDVNGRFSLNVPHNAVLVVSSIGFLPQEIALTGRSSLDIILVRDTKALDEVVVIGYGTAKKSEFTGAASIIDMNEMLKTPISSFAEGLAGRASGVQVTTQDGQPGTQSDIIIRGASSMTQSNKPLYVIDGFPIDDLDQTSLNPNDIESISILKDASSTSIYGSRGTNGVVMITTKKGKTGKPVITLNSSLGFQKISNKMEIMGPYEFLKYQMERSPSFTNSYYLFDGRTIDDYRNAEKVDFQDYLFRTAKVNNHNLSIRGGSENTKYTASLSAYLQDGIIVNSGYNRYQGRVSLDQTVNSKLKVGVMTNYSDIVSYGAPVSVGSTGDGQLTLTNYLFVTAWGYRPVAGRDSTDFFNEDVDPLYADMRMNPVTSSKNEYRKNISNIFIGNAYADYSIFKDLILHVQGGITRTTSTSEDFFNSKTTRGRPYSLNIVGINARVLNSSLTVLSNENTLTYRKSIKDHTHNFEALAGYSMQTVKGMRYGFSSTFIPSEELGMSGIDGGLIKDPVAGPTDYASVSYFGRLNYNYKSKYIVTGTLRRDGVSKFAKENRWGDFPSAAFAWNLASEDFMAPITFLSNAKFRISYGVTGNNRVSDFAYLPGLTVSSFNPAYSFHNSTPSAGMWQNGMENRKLRWESSPQTDLGIELGFFNNRIMATFDVYKKLTKGLLMNVDMPSNAPVGRVFMNSGEIDNRGWEFELNTVNISTNDFRWNTSFNISHNRNKIISLADNQPIYFSSISFNSQYNMPAYISKVGMPMGQFWGLIHDGNYQYSDFDNPEEGVYVLKETVTTNGSPRTSIRPGDIKYKDLNGDLVVNSEDRDFLGSPFPKHIGGFSNDFVFKDFDFNIFFQWSYGNKVMNANRYILEGNSTQLEGMNQFASYANRWSPDNPTNKNFRTGGQGPMAYSSRVIEDASFLRLKAVAFGYSLPGSLIKKLKIEQLRFSISANNLITWTNYSGLDPEVSVRNTSILTQGFDFSAYPRNRVITFGLNVSF